MLNKIFVFFIFTLLAGCSSTPEGYMKLSANNKIFDRKGFKGGKRLPLYNKKYISQAKKNVVNENYDEDDYEDDLGETENISRDNIEMYKMMIDNDRDNKPRRNSNKRIYPSIVNANDKINSHPKSNDLELREEIEKIKALLDDTKKDLASYRCPTAEELESVANKNRQNQEVKNKIKQDDDTRTKNLNNKSTIIEPVQSI